MSVASTLYVCSSNLSTVTWAALVSGKETRNLRRIASLKFNKIDVRKRIIKLPSHTTYSLLHLCSPMKYIVEGYAFEGASDACH